MSHWRSLAEAEGAEAEARRREPLSMRVRVHMRDGWRCCACARATRQSGGPPEQVATLDHRIPISRGGRSSPDNLQTMCRACNSAKGASLAATPAEAQVAEVLSARSPGGYVAGSVLRLGTSPAGVEAWLYWPDVFSRGFEPAYSRQRDPRRDPAPPLRVRLELLGGWDRFGWRRCRERPEADDAPGTDEGPLEGLACAQ